MTKSSVVVRNAFFQRGDRLGRPVISCSKEESRTKQSFKDECDINFIMKRYEKTGVIDFVNRRAARFGDATAQDFHESMCLVRDASAAFDGLPAHLRSRFQNDPEQLLAFLDDDENRAEAVKLGLVEEKKAEPDRSAVLDDLAAVVVSRKPRPKAGPATKEQQPASGEEVSGARQDRHD